MDYSRRRFIRVVSAVLAAITAKALPAAESSIDVPSGKGNFRYIYGNSAFSKDFYKFLENVFRLQPEVELHQFISRITEQYADDEDICKNLQRQIDTVRPFLSELKYALPALGRQKKVIADQMIELLPGKAYHEGYLEVGSTVLREYGFRSDGVQLYQESDPTLNALILYKTA